MLNYEFFKLRNFFSLGLIVLIWLTIHHKFIAPVLVKDGK